MSALPYDKLYDFIYKKSPVYQESMGAETGHDAKGSVVRTVVEAVGPKSVLDLGCGQGHYLRMMRQELGIEGSGVEVSRVCCETYLQAIPHANTDAITFLKEGKSFDFLLCTDVLEHIDPGHVEELLHWAAQASGEALYGIANHSDVQMGLELHLIQEDAAWWADLLARSYASVSLLGEMYGGRFFFLYCRK